MRCDVCGTEVISPLVVRAENRRPVLCSRDCLEVLVGSSESDTTLERKILRERAKVTAEIEDERGTKLISMIHRSEQSRNRHQYITIDDSEVILDKIRSIDSNRPIDFLIHCPGGLVLPAEQIALALNDREAKVSVIVPHYAMSGATLIALAADEMMDPHSVLGPLGPQIEGVPAPVLLKAVKMKPAQYVSENFLVSAEIAETRPNIRLRAASVGAQTGGRASGKSY